MSATTAPTPMKPTFAEGPSAALRLGPSGAALFALSYAVIMTAQPLLIFKDRENYLEYAKYSADIFSRVYDISPLAALANEPLWLGINVALSSFLPPEATMRVIIFLPAFIAPYLALRAAPRHWPWVIFFFLTPQVMKNHVIHLRQGLGLAVFLLGWFAANSRLKVILIGASAFIHASFFFVIALLAGSTMMRRLRLGADLRSLAYLGVGLLIGIGLGIIASALGARQAEEYEFSSAAISGLGFVFWTTITGLYASAGKRFLREYSLENGVLLFYLGTYFFVEVTARIFESGLLLTLLASFKLPPLRKLCFQALVVLYGTYQTIQLIGGGGYVP